MRNDKHLAIKLRKQGKSYNKISKELKISKGTLANWFSGLNWSVKIKRELERKASCIIKKKFRITNKLRGEYWEQWRESFRIKAREEFPIFLNDPLFVSGINLYWGEGDSKLKNGIVRLVNTDPRMLLLFVNFLIKFCGVERAKISISLTLYPDLNDKKCKKFWSETLLISLNQFWKTQFIKGRHPTKRVENGMCCVVVHSRGLKEKIFVWTNMLVENLKVRV